MTKFQLKSGTVPECTFHKKSITIAGLYREGPFKRIILSDGNKVSIALASKTDHYMVFNYFVKLFNNRYSIFDIRKLKRFSPSQELDLINTKPSKRIEKISGHISKLNIQAFDNLPVATIL